MTKAPAGPLKLIRRMAEEHRLKQLTDPELLRRFCSECDEVAFHALVHRHGAMVLDVCRNVLGNEADAEDAFQATFLILAKKAGAIREQGSFASWLYGVAYRTALKARADSARRQKREAATPTQPPSDPSDDLTLREVRQVLHEELNGLPECYRAPLLLCYLQGKTQNEAATLLAVSRATTQKRLERGLALLRSRLLRRGVGAVAVLFAAAWPVGNATAHVPQLLISSTVNAATLFAAGQAAAGELISAKVATLTQGVLRTMFIMKLKTAMATMLVAGMLISSLLLSSLGALPDSMLVAQESGNVKQKDALAQRPTAQPAQAESTLTQPAALSLIGHKGEIRNVAFAPDGKVLATAGTDRTVRLWNIATGKETRKLDQPGEAVSLAFSRDGKILASGSAGKEGAVTLWDTTTGNLTFRHSHRGDWSGTVSLTYDNRGRLFVVAGQQRCCVIGFDAELGPGRSLSEGLGGTAAITAIVRSSVGGVRAYGDTDGVIYLSYQGGRIQKLGDKGNGAVIALAFLDGGAKVAAADGGQSIRILDVKSGKEETAFAGTEAIRALATSTDDKHLATAGAAGEVRIWDTAARREERRFSAGKGRAYALSFSTDGKCLATVGAEGTAVVWDLVRDQKSLPK